MYANLDHLTISYGPALESFHYLNIVSRSPFTFLLGMIVVNMCGSSSFKLILKFGFH